MLFLFSIFRKICSFVLLSLGKYALLVPCLYKKIAILSLCFRSCGVFSVVLQCFVKLGSKIVTFLLKGQNHNFLKVKG